MSMIDFLCPIGQYENKNDNNNKFFRCIFHFTKHLLTVTNK